MSLADYRRHERGSGSADRGTEWAVDGSGAEVRLRILRGARPEQRRQFLRRAELWQGLAHPNVVPIREIGEEPEGPYLVEDLAAGVDLSSIVALGRHGFRTRVEILIQVVEALEFAHRQQVLHRGLAPSEVRVSSTGAVAVAGFGVVRLLTHADAETDMEMAAVTALARLAPEQMMGGEASVASDTYAFGVLAHELLSGEFPFSTESAAVLLAAKMQERPPTLEQVCPACPKAMRELVMECMARDPQGRPSDFEEVGRRLRRILEAADDELAGEGEGEADRGVAGDSRAATEVAVGEEGATGTAVAVARRTVADRVGPGLRAAARRSRRWVVVHPRTSLAAATLLAVGVIFSLVGTGHDGSGELGPMAASTPIAVTPSAAMPSVREVGGVLRIDARPWAEIVSIVGTDGRPVPTPPLRYTPMLLRLPDGLYVVQLRRPDRVAPATCSATVVEGTVADCVVEFLAVSPQKYFREIGWWR